MDQSHDLRSVINRIKFVWGSHRVWGGTDIQHWLQHPLVQERINFKVSGARNVNRFEYFLNRYLQGKMPVERALTLGSGVGELERGLCRYGFDHLRRLFSVEDELTASGKLADDFAVIVATTKAV